MTSCHGVAERSKAVVTVDCKEAIFIVEQHRAAKSETVTHDDSIGDIGGVRPRKAQRLLVAVRGDENFTAGAPGYRLGKSPRDLTPGVGLEAQLSASCHRNQEGS
ncbi:MAG: hypothetical protein HOM67_03965 [Halieaceae bacterium]|nr:hypothetical protein [Halieaceae bacterium]